MKESSAELPETDVVRDGRHTQPSAGGLRMPPSAVTATSDHASVAAVNSLLSDEIILRIWQYLGAAELARLQCVSRRFNSLAADPQIWKALYLQTFVGDWLRLQQQLDPALPPMSGKYDRQRVLLSLRKQGGSSRAYWGLPEQYYVRNTWTAGSDETYSNGIEQGRDRTGFGHRESDEDAPCNDGLDWQALFRVSSNWRKGRFAFSELPNPAQQEVPPSSLERSMRAEPPLKSITGSASGMTTGRRPNNSISPSDRDAFDRYGATVLMESAGNLIFTASRSTCDGPEHSGHSSTRWPCVKVYRIQVLPATLRERAARTREDLAPASPALELRSKELRAAVASRKAGMPTITDIKADTASSSANVRLFVAYSSGDWSVFRLTIDPWSVITATEEVFCNKSSLTLPQSTQCSIMSAFHFPILATCTEAFDIAIFKLSDYAQPASVKANVSVRLLRNMKGSNCHWPASMSLASIAVAQNDLVTSDEKTDDRKRKRMPSPTYQDPNHGSGSGASRSFAGMKAARKRRRHCESRMSLASGMPSDVCVEISQPNQAFRLDIAYSTPCYPDNWSISLQEIIIVLSGLEEGGGSSITSRYATARPRLTGHRPGTFPREGRLRGDGRGDHEVSVTGTERPRSSSRQANAQRSIFHSPPAGRGPSSGDRPLYGGSRITSITNDERTLVAGSVDNLLDVYKISGSMRRAALTPSTDISVAPRQDLTLEHCQVLQGHGASVSSVALNGDRIVSGSTDGNIMVWTLKQNPDLVSSSSLSHTITLRTPLPGSIPLLPSTDAALPRTLFRLLAQARAAQAQRMPCAAEEGTHAAQRTSSIAPTQVKRVSTTFDRILSVTGAAQSDVARMNEECSVERSDQTEEQVNDDRGEKLQVWSFAG